MDGKPPMEGPVQLSVVIQAGRQRGDLDHYVGGICNGLAMAPATARLSPIWSEPAPISPLHALAYFDDAQVRAVYAELLPNDGSGPSGYWYAVAVEPYPAPVVPGWWTELL